MTDAKAEMHHEDELNNEEDKTKETFESPEVLYCSLISAIHKYHPSTDISMIEKAYKRAYKAHEGQCRKSGEPYINHPISVAIILADLELDKETIVAGLLHDVVEDTIMTVEQITEEFGEEVALLVDGVTKLTLLSYSGDKVERQAENLRKMFLAMAKDIRVILVKLADRLHNMRTLQYMPANKQKDKARETRDIYAPIALRLGISKIKTELDDLSLKYLEPDIYADLVEKINIRKSAREMFINDIIRSVSECIREADVDARIEGRVKHFFSIYKKILNQNKTLDQVYDLFAIRLLVDSVKDCYAALGVIHGRFMTIPGRFKDYISVPKANMYQSLHTTVIGPSGQPFEIQIRTYAMHKTAEYGIAAHWKYKSNKDGKNSADTEEEKLSWLKQILEWQREMSDNKEFMNLLKSDLDLFSESVYCFTPTGDVKHLPSGSTTIDFAYSIHSAVGNKMIGARVNNRLVSIDYVVQNGDQIEIVTSQNSKGPSHDWLKLVKSTQAKNKINQWFRSELKEDHIAKGKELLDKYCKNKSVAFTDLNKPDFQERVMAKYGFKHWEAVLAAVGRGGLKDGQVINRLIEEYDRKNKKALSESDVLEALTGSGERHRRSRGKSGVIVKGIHDLSIRLPRCCGPIHGDEIIGFVTRGRGVTIHRTDCVNIVHLPEIDRDRLIEAEWEKTRNDSTDDQYFVEIMIFAYNRVGILEGIAKVFVEKGLDVARIESRTSKQGTAIITMSFQVTTVEELNKVIDRIRSVEGIYDVKRTTG